MWMVADVMMSLQRAVCVVGQHKLMKEKKNKQSSKEKVSFDRDN